MKRIGIEEARKIANERFTKLIQPIINEPEQDAPEMNPDEFNLKVEGLKADLKRETGYEVEMFYVNPLGFGMYEVTTVFKTGEKRRRTNNALLHN